MSRMRRRAETAYFSNPMIGNSKSSTSSESKIKLENQKTIASSSIKKKPVSQDGLSLTPKMSIIRNALITKDNIFDLREDNIANGGDTPYRDASKTPNSKEPVFTNKRIYSRRNTISSMHSPSIAIRRSERILIGASNAIVKEEQQYHDDSITLRLTAKITEDRNDVISDDSLTKRIRIDDSCFLNGSLIGMPPSSHHNTDLCALESVVDVQLLQRKTNCLETFKRALLPIELPVDLKKPIRKTEDITVVSPYQDVSLTPNPTETGLTNNRISSRRQTISSMKCSSVPVRRCKRLLTTTSPASVKENKISTPTSSHCNQNTRTCINSEPVGKNKPVRRKAICTETLKRVLFPPESSFVLKESIRMAENSTVESHSLTPDPIETGLKSRRISVRRKTISSMAPSVPVRRCERLLTNTFTANKEQVNHGDSENETLTPACSRYNMITRTVSTSEPIEKCKPVQRKATCTTETFKRTLFPNKSSFHLTEPIRMIGDSTVDTIYKDVPLTLNPSTGSKNKRISLRRKTISSTPSNLPLRRSERLLNNSTPDIVKKDFRILIPKTSTYQNVSSSKRLRIDTPTFRKELFPIEPTFGLNKTVPTTEDSKADVQCQNNSVSLKRISARRSTISSMQISTLPVRQSKISSNKTSTPIVVVKSKEKSANRKPAVIHAIDEIETNNVNDKLVSATKISNKSKSMCIALHSEKQAEAKTSLLKSDVNGIEAKGKIEIIIPHALMLLLIRDANAVKNRKKLYKIPATQNVAKIIEDYVALKQPENVCEYGHGLTFNQVFANIIEYCDKLLGEQLLYSSAEREQYLDLQNNFGERKMSTLYTPIYLLRQIVQLNSLIQMSNRDKDSRQFAANYMTEFAKYLAENHSFFADMNSFC